MAQHDLIIDNASGAAVRSDLNSALAAMGSTQRGPSAPPAPLTGMLWIDDNTPSATVWTLNLYDGADWVGLGTLDTSANRFSPSNAGALPITASGIGQWLLISPGPGVAAVLSSGGTWAYFLINVNNSTAGFNGFYASSVAAGGSTVGSVVAGGSWIGFAWRIA